MLLPLALVIGCTSTVKESIKTQPAIATTITRYENVSWKIDYNTGYLNVVSAEHQKEWTLTDNFDMVMAKSNGSLLENYFYDYSGIHYRLVVFKIL